MFTHHLHLQGRHMNTKLNYTNGAPAKFILWGIEEEAA